MQLFMGHIVSSLHLLKERIFFFMCILNLVFFKKLGLCLFIYPHPLYFFLKNCFSQNLFCFSYFYRGRNFFNLCGSQRELLLFIGGVVSISYKVKLFCVPLILYFLLSFIAYVYSLMGCLCQYVTKRGREIQMRIYGNLVCFVQGELKLFF